MRERSFAHGRMLEGEARFTGPVERFIISYNDIILYRGETERKLGALRVAETKPPSPLFAMAREHHEITQQGGRVW